MGYVAWKGGDQARAETLFTRAIEADKQHRVGGARLNLAQILRERARQTGNAGEREAAVRGRCRPTCARCWRSTATTCRPTPTSATSTTTSNLLELAQLVGNQAIKRAEEIATGKFDRTRRSKTAGDEGVGLSAKGEGQGATTAKTAAPAGKEAVRRPRAPATPRR